MVQLTLDFRMIYSKNTLKVLNLNMVSWNIEEQGVII